MKKAHQPSLIFPASAEQWRDCVSSVALPILDASKSALNRSGGGQGMSASKLAAIARLDPSLRLQLLSFINRAISQYDSPALESGVRSIDHGATLVGLDQTLKFARSLPVASGIGDQLRLVGFTQALARAFIGGEVALAWMKVAGRDFGDGLCHATLNGLFAEALIWTCAQLPAETLSRLLDAESTKSAATEKRCLGLSCDEIGEVLSKAWSMPPVAPLNAVYLRAVRDVARAAALFTRVMETDASSNVIDRQLRAASKHLEVEPNKLRAIAHRCIAESARQFSVPTCVQVARNLLVVQSAKLLPDWYVSPEEAAAAEAKPTSPLPASVPQSNVVQIRAAEPEAGHCERVLNAYQSKQIPVHTAMQQLVESAKRELSCKRVVLCMMNRDRSHVVGRFTSESGEDVRTTFNFVLEPGSLLSKVLEKQAGLVVSSSNRTKLTAQLPGACLSEFDDRAFCLMPIFARSKAIGLMLAEFFDPAPDERSYQTFKQLCISTSQAIERGVAA